MTTFVATCGHPTARCSWSSEPQPSTESAVAWLARHYRFQHEWQAEPTGSVKEVEE